MAPIISPCKAFRGRCPQLDLRGRFGSQILGASILQSMCGQISALFPLACFAEMRKDLSLNLHGSCSRRSQPPHFCLDYAGTRVDRREAIEWSIDPRFSALPAPRDTPRKYVNSHIETSRKHRSDLPRSRPDQWSEGVLRTRGRACRTWHQKFCPSFWKVECGTASESNQSELWTSRRVTDSIQSQQVQSKSKLQPAREPCIHTYFVRHLWTCSVHVNGN